MRVKMKNYPYNDYIDYVNNFDSTCRTNHYDGTRNREFFQGMLNISQYRCYYCGQSLITNSISGVYYEREHIINKKYYGRPTEGVNPTLNKCKYNLIPICKTCNSLKKYITASKDLVNELNDLESLECKGSRSIVCDNFKECFDDFEDENFNPYSDEVEFEILHKIYVGDESYISQLKLNSRTRNLFMNIFERLYRINVNFGNRGFIRHLKSFTTNSIEDKLIDYLDRIGLIDDYGTIDNTKEKLDNLIETIVLLEEFG